MINKIAILVFFFALFLGSTVFGQKDTLYHHSNHFEQEGNFVLDASVMSVDANQGILIVAEKTIKLRTDVDKEGYRYYKTIFIDSSGQRISIADFKPRMNVIVVGTELPDDTIMADQITLLLE